MSEIDQAEEFERLRLRLELTNLRIARLYLLGKGQAAQSAESTDPLEELYVSDSEFQGHLAALAGLPPTWVDNPDVAESLEAIDGALEVVGRRVQFRTAHARRQGRLSRFEHLCERCELSELDQEILLIALAPEVDRRYRRVFAYLHDDFTRGIPSVGLVVDVLAPLIEGGDRLGTLSRFESGSSLIHRGLVELLPARADDVRPLSQRHLRVSDAAGGWLLGVPRMSEQVADRARYTGVPARPAGVSMPLGAPAELDDLADRIRTSSLDVTVVFVGPDIASCRAAADHLAHAIPRPIVKVEVATFLGGGERVLEDVGQVLRDAFLMGAALQVEGFPDVSVEEPAMLRNLEAVWRRMQDFKGPILVPLRAQPPASWLAEYRHAVTWRVDPPTFRDRIRVLESLVEDAGVPAMVAAEDIESLANRYRLDRRQLQQAVAFARDQCWARRQAGGELAQDRPNLDFDDLVAGARAQFARDIGSLARRIEPRFGFKDLVLPAKEKQHITELIAFVEKRGQVYESWGFETKFPRGTGAKALFFGRSGTGKTMAAECIASDLGLDLFKVDLSSVVSKWVGETEKNLAAIFDRAEEAQAVLLFDEADALFGQRTSVGNAVDRYANLETNYLLQRIEEYSGIAILSSNFKQNIDEAFTRRFHFVIEFPFPDRPSREEIWQRAFPAAAPLADDVDFGFLADRFKFTGGNIKNSVLRAAFLGATGGESIRMVHVLHGVLREYQNLERDPIERDFGPWWGEMRPYIEKTKGARKKGQR